MKRMNSSPPRVSLPPPAEMLNEGRGVQGGEEHGYDGSKETDEELSPLCIR